MRACAVFLILLAGCGQQAANQPSASAPRGTLAAVATKPKPARPTGKPVRVDAYALWEAFGENEAAAEAKYGGRLLEITPANATKVMKQGGGYVVGLVVTEYPGLTPAQVAGLSERERRWYDEGIPPSVLCKPNPSSHAAAAKIGDKTAFVIRGVLSGKRKDTESYKGYVVELADCEVILEK